MPEINRIGVGAVRPRQICASSEWDCQQCGGGEKTSKCGRFHRGNRAGEPFRIFTFVDLGMSNRTYVKTEDAPRRRRSQSKNRADRPIKVQRTRNVTSFVPPERPNHSSEK